LAVVEQFAEIPETHWMIIKLEDLSYRVYLDVARLLGVKSQIREKDYMQIAKSRPGRRGQAYTLADWSAVELSEFESQVQPAAEYFGYEYRVKTLMATPQVGKHQHASYIGNLLRIAQTKVSRSIKRVV